MAYVNMKDILLKARAGHYAVGAFNIVNYLTAKAAVEAAEALESDIILQTSVKTVKAIGISETMRILRPIAENSKINVAVHLDHSTDIDFTKKCIDAGWSSVMYDGSKLPLESNIKNTKDIVAYARPKNVTVEGELGAIVGVEDDIFVKKDAGAYANPDDCRKFLAETGVDAFAPAIGTAHGLYKGDIVLNYELFQQINSFSSCPLVLHGGTGLSEEMFCKLIDLGVAKINISTAIKIAYCQGMNSYLTANGDQNDPLKLDAYVSDMVREIVSRHISIFNYRQKNRKAEYEVDLHCHTTRSDGEDTPKELIDNAVKRGMKIIAITDHDVLPPELIEVNGVMVEPRKYANSLGLDIIPGIEFSCETEVEDVHIVGLGCDFTNKKLIDMNERIIKSKIKSYNELIRRLTEDGLSITWNEVLNYGGIPRREKDIQKKLIFNLMADKGYAKSWKDAKILCRDNPRYDVKREKPGAIEIIKLIHETGGLAILAHPYLIDEKISITTGDITREAFIDLLIQNGLDGIEASYTYDKTIYRGKLTKEEVIEKIRNTYSNRVRIISGGSDYHADMKRTNKNVRQIGECGISYKYFINNAALSKLLKR